MSTINLKIYIKIHSNVHLLPKTSHLWVLAGSLCRSDRVSFLVHKDQDQMNVVFFFY
jgi:DNA-directed RNA polymerase subunit beta'